METRQCGASSLWRFYQRNLRGLGPRPPANEKRSHEKRSHEKGDDNPRSPKVPRRDTLSKSPYVENFPNASPADTNQDPCATQHDQQQTNTFEYRHTPIEHPNHHTSENQAPTEAELKLAEIIQKCKRLEEALDKSERARVELEMTVANEQANSKRLQSEVSQLTKECIELKDDRDKAKKELDHAQEHIISLGRGLNWDEPEKEEHQPTKKPNSPVSQSLDDDDDDFLVSGDHNEIGSEEFFPYYAPSTAAHPDFQKRPDAWLYLN
eukprot:TRINITY_DN17273_c0_g1_i1.p1 TRINITY_DN17273_c0_g1~~TRINITY_DN17273_c0_g1_i1.p1  ORF type:complete len:266 (-),score=39.69 TRINITY_DN17273_c0_g1_i1:30-827(-)